MRNATHASLLLAAQSCGMACSRKVQPVTGGKQAAGGATKKSQAVQACKKVNRPSGPAMSCSRKRTGWRRKKSTCDGARHAG